MDVTTRPAPGAVVGEESFSDITDEQVTAVSWMDGSIVVSFSGDLTPAQQVAVEQRIKSTSAGEETIRLRAAEYLTRPGLDSLAEAHVQLRLLTRLVLGVDSEMLPGSNPGQDQAAAALSQTTKPENTTRRR